MRSKLELGYSMQCWVIVYITNDGLVYNGWGLRDELSRSI